MKLYIPKPTIDSSIIRLVVELERLRNRPISSTSKSTPPWLFFELKAIFHTIESIASARIEGNHTTVANFVEAVREDEDEAMGQNEQIREIINIEKGIDFVESRGDLRIDKDLVTQLHRIVVSGLNPGHEGSQRPGSYRNEPRSIRKSSIALAQWPDIPERMNDLLKFINSKVEPQFDLIKDAVAHHYFTWIHPFDNGNGRVVRLLTYAMLAKQGFIDGNGMRILSPAAVLGSNRRQYYDMLAKADKNTDEGLLEWSEYMLSGIKSEVNKINDLLDGSHAREKIIIPALDFALDKRRINHLEYKMLKIAAENEVVQAADYRHLFPADVSHVNISKAIRKLREQSLLSPIGGDNARRYALQLNRNTLTFGVIKQLDDHGYLPIQDAG